LPDCSKRPREFAQGEIHAPQDALIIGSTVGPCRLARDRHVVHGLCRSRDYPLGQTRNKKQLACLIHDGEQDVLYLMFNASAEAAVFRVPPAPGDAPWRLAVDNSRESPQDLFPPGEEPLLDTRRHIL
jgi:hypothetical protein